MSPHFKETGLRPAALSVSCHRFRPRIGMALASCYCPFFLETLEAFGQLQRTKLAKSVIITMPLQTANVSAERIGQEEPGFAMSLQEVLSDWVIGKRSSADVGKSCGQLFRRTLAQMTERDNRSYPDNGSGTASANITRQEDTLWETILGCITYAALQRVLRKSRFDDSTPLIQFSVSTSERNGVLSSKYRKSLQSLFSTKNRTRRISIRTRIRNASNRFAVLLYRF